MKFDHIVVGSGPGGAMLARQLARTGQRVLILERGRDWRGHPLYGSYAGPLMYADKRSLLFTREGMNVIRPLMVGGATSMFAACASQPLPWWHEYGIDLDDDASSLSAELDIRVLPPALLGIASTRVAEAGIDLGMAWVPQEKFMWPDRAAPFDCGAHCLLGCSCGAKWNAGELVDEAVAAGAVLWTRARVERVLQTHGSASGVRGRRAGLPFTVEAPSVILAAGGIGTPHILRTSGFAEAGRGIAMDTTVIVYGTSYERGMGGDPPMTWSAVDDDLGVMYSTLLDPWLAYPIILARQGVTRPLRWRSWGRTLGVMIKLSDDISGGIDDRGGISKGVTVRDQRRIDRAVSVATAVLLRAGCTADTIFTSPLRGTHPCATARIGEMLDSSLATSLPGLHVCDASVFPRALGRPTVLTILALARRLARALSANAERAAHARPSLPDLQPDGYD